MATGWRQGRWFYGRESRLGKCLPACVLDEPVGALCNLSEMGYVSCCVEVFDNVEQQVIGETCQGRSCHDTGHMRFFARGFYFILKNKQKVRLVLASY
jgi:hypothetical protein